LLLGGNVRNRFSSRGGGGLQACRQDKGQYKWMHRVVD
jgi:hypothetical protein